MLGRPFTLLPVSFLYYHPISECYTLAKPDILSTRRFTCNAGTGCNRIAAVLPLFTSGCTIVGDDDRTRFLSCTSSQSAQFETVISLSLSGRQKHFGRGCDLAIASSRSWILAEAFDRSRDQGKYHNVGEVQCSRVWRSRFSKWQSKCLCIVGVHMVHSSMSR